MSATTKQMRCDTSSKTLRELSDILKLELDAELVYEQRKTLGGGAVLLLSFERLYLRNAGYASLTILLTEQDGALTADLIGSGGGAGIFNGDLGANENFANMAASILQKHGFTETA